MGRVPRSATASGMASTNAVVTLVVAALVVILAIAACSSPTVPDSPTPGASGLPSQGQGQSQSPGSSAPATTTIGTPGPSASLAIGASPTPFRSRLGRDPCRLLSADEVNAALVGGYQPGGGQGLACVFPSSAQGSGASLFSVAVVDGDVISPIRSRYPDLQDVTVDTGKAEWSPSVATLWLIVDGPRTVMVSVPGSTMADDQLKTVALQLAQLAAGRI